MTKIYVLDTNILIYKVFTDVKVKDHLIWNRRPEFSAAVKEEWDRLTNQKNALVITDTAFKEFQRLWKFEFDDFVYKKNFRNVTHKEFKQQIKKRINNMNEKHSYKNLFKEVPVTEKNYGEIVSFFEEFKEKLQEITEGKLRGLPEEVKQKKLLSRKNGYLPEKSDLKLLSESMFMRQNLPEQFEGVCLFTNDKDFTSFKNEIETFSHIEIHPLKITA